MDILIVTISLIVCYVTGNIIEKNHYKKIREREIKLYKQPCITFAKRVLKDQPVKESFLVSSSVVLGCDYFKSFKKL